MKNQYSISKKIWRSLRENSKVSKRDLKRSLKDLEETLIWHPIDSQRASKVLKYFSKYFVYRYIIFSFQWGFGILCFSIPWFSSSMLTSSSSGGHSSSSSSLPLADSLSSYSLSSRSSPVSVFASLAFLSVVLP